MWGVGCPKAVRHSTASASLSSDDDVQAGGPDSGLARAKNSTG